MAISVLMVVLGGFLGSVASALIYINSKRERFRLTGLTVCTLAAIMVGHMTVRISVSSSHLTLDGALLLLSASAFAGLPWVLRAWLPPTGEHH